MSPAEESTPSSAQAIERALLVAAAMTCLAVVTLDAWVCDDAYYSFRAAWNAVHGYAFAFNATERVQAFTNPLWTLALTATHFVTRLPLYTVSLALSIGCTIALIGVLTRAMSTRAATVAVLLLASSKAFVDYATSGLENPLTHLLVALFAVQVLRSDPEGRSTPRICLLAGLCLVCRLDALLLVGPATAVVLLRSPRATWLRAIGYGATPLILWEAFSLLYYGSLLPTSFWAKLGYTVDRDFALLNGIGYLAHNWRIDRVTQPVVLLGALAAVASLDSKRVALACGAALQIGYVVTTGADYMSGRFLSAPAVICVVLLATSEWTRRRPVALGLGACAVIASLLSPQSPFRAGPTLGQDRFGGVDDLGIADERRYYYADTGLFRPRSGRDLVPIRSPDPPPDGAVLTRAPCLDDGAAYPFMLGPTAHGVGPFALTDLFLAHLPPGAIHNRPGHIGRVIPPAYLESLERDENLLTDPVLRSLYDDVQLVVRGPLLGPGRLGAIWRLHRPRAGLGPLYTGPEGPGSRTP